MNEIVRYEKGQPVQINEITKSDSSSSSAADEQVLCTHDGVLLRNASAEYILDQDMNSSGSLSLIELLSTKRMFFEWRPNDSIVITDDDYCDDHDQEWSIVDKIHKRPRTISECRIFKCEMPASPHTKPKCIRVDIEHLRSLELTSKGHCVRFKRKSGELHSEYFFQHGNADIFIRALQSFHIIEGIQGNRSEYPIINTDPQKLMKTFAMLDLDEIKDSHVNMSRIFSNPVADFLIKVGSGASKLSPVSRKTSPTEYEDLGVPKDKEDQKEKENGEKMEKDVQECEERKRFVVLPEKRIVTRGEPLSETSWRAQKTPDGQIHNPSLLKQTIFRGGIVPSLRCEVWKYLLGFYDWNHTTSQLAEHRRRKSTEYYQMKAQWLSMSVKQEQNFNGYRDRKAQIEKDVKRTDRSMTYFAGDENKNLMVLQDILMTYVMYNFDLGYVQGMSDLLAPILIIQQNEVDAFWCFVGFMDMVYSNFDIDQAGMKKQLSYLTTLLEFCNEDLYDYFKSNGSDNMYFCFRWLLVWFKREFSNEDILVLWESLWTGLPCQNFHLLLSIAILEQESQKIIENEFSFTDILKHVNDLSMSINLKYSLELAEAIYGQIRDSESLSNKLRVIVGLEPVEGEDGDEMDGEGKQEDFDDSFDDIVRELTPDEKKLREQKLEEACEQSMFLSFM